MVYQAKYNALDANGAPYNFSSIPSGTYSNRKDTKKALKNLLDDSWETKAEVDPLQPKIGGKPFRPTLDLGAGMQIKLSNKFNIAIEDKFSSPKTDLLDGQQWQENFTAADPGSVSITQTAPAAPPFRLRPEAQAERLVPAARPAR
jgi:hypothetical protein